jgi:CRISPR-associated protein Cas1
MRKLLNMLYVTSPEARLLKDGETIIISVDEQKKLQLPVHTLEGIVCFGYTGASPALMNLCAERGVSLSFHNEYGKFLARIQGPAQGNVLLRKEQYRVADNEQKCLQISKNIIMAKIINSRSVLQRALRDHGSEINTAKVENIIEKLKYALENIKQTDTMNSLRGLEGDCARQYFSVFNEMIVQQKNDFVFNGRTKRPPQDRVNALLSFLYTMLTHEVQSALESVGLDPYVGFMHQDRPGRPSLALDLMEEFRQFFSDRMTLSLINKRQLNKKSFIEKENGTILLDKEAKKVVLEAMHNRKREEITHPFLGEKIQIGLLPYVQALLLARFLRGDTTAYPPFIVKPFGAKLYPPKRTGI